jgi:DNA polymerase-1
VDGHALAYRMYFALENTRMATRRGQPTWAGYGFFNALFSVIKQTQPAAVAVAFDVGKDTFRHQMYAAYKGHREAMPDDLRAQLGLIDEGVRCLGMPVFTHAGFEADDLIGTLSARAVEAGWQVQILTGDQDAFQLVEDPGVQVLMPGRTPRDGLKCYDKQAVFEKTGVLPVQVPDFKGLKGDPSDNIPGVPGVGDKTAAKLLAVFPTLEAVYSHLATVTPASLQQKLANHKEQALLGKHLATIVRDIPLTLDWDACHLRVDHPDALRAFLERYEFRSFLQQAPTVLAPFFPAGVPPNWYNNSSSAGPGHGAMRDEVLPAQRDAAPAADVGSPQPLPALPERFRQAPSHPLLITTPEALQGWVARIEAAGVFAVDLETTALNPLDAHIAGVALAVGTGLLAQPRAAANPMRLPDEPTQTFSLATAEESPPHWDAAYIPLLHTGVWPQLPSEAVLSALRPLLASPHIVKLVHHAKFEWAVFRQTGLKLAGPVYDTMLASYVLHPERRHGLKPLAEATLGWSMGTYEQLVGTGKKAVPFVDVPIEQSAPYAMADAAATWSLAWLQAPQLADTEQAALLYEVELPLSEVLAAMERTGIAVDTAYLAGLSQQLGQRLATAEAQLYTLAGIPFNPNSPKQVADLLFDRLGIRPLGKTPTKAAFSTDARVLEQLLDAHPIISQLLDYRQLFKLKSTYVDNLPGLMHPKTGRIHTSYNQTITATGRLSSSNPNLQNIPIRTDLGRQIRKAFIPRPGWQLLSADYSQIELRLLAHFSEEPRLISAFAQGADIHAATAAQIFGVALDAVSKDQRARAKTVNFGVIYGQSAHGLSQQLQISRAEAQAFIDQYFATYPGVRAYIERVKAEAHQTGQVRTLLGRIRDLSTDLNSRNRAVREFAERAAFNTPLQGSAADLMKLAMVRLYRKFQAQPAIQARMLLQVHDELVLEVPPEEMELVKSWVEEAMTLSQCLRVPLVVDHHIGENWMES